MNSIDRRLAKLRFKPAVRFAIGMRVKTSESCPYGAGRPGTVRSLPGRGSGPREWIGVEFDDNPGNVAEWHRDYFDPPEPCEVKR